MKRLVTRLQSLENSGVEGEKLVQTKLAHFILFFLYSIIFAVNRYVTAFISMTNRREFVDYGEARGDKCILWHLRS